MNIHVEKKRNDKFDEWQNKMYGGYRKVKSNSGKVHNYLGMELYFSGRNKVKVDMIDLNEWNGQQFYHQVKSKLYNPVPIYGYFLLFAKVKNDQGKSSVITHSC